MTRVGVLRGGNAFGYDKSLKAGAAALKHLNKHQVQDIFIDKKGNWHVQGMSVAPHDVTKHVDVIFNTLGDFDRNVHHFLHHQSVPYTGSRAFESSVINNRLLAKKAFTTNALKTPFYKEIHPGTDVLSIFRTFPMPAVIKYFSKPDVHVVQSIADLEKYLNSDETILIEEFIPGTKVSVHVIENYRDQDIYVLPPVEIHPSKNIVPSNFAHNIKESLINFGKKVHELLSLKHYSHSDFIVHPKRGIFLIRVNSAPDLSEDSALIQSLHSVGSSAPHFVDHILEMALEGK